MSGAYRTGHKYRAMARACSLSYPQDLYLLLPSSVDLRRSVPSEVLSVTNLRHARVSLNSHDRTDWLTDRFLVIGLVR